MQMAAIYTRVSSNQQREAHTIASQTAALVEWATKLELEVPQQWIFEDEGYSGATLERPGLEQVRDLAAAGDIQVVLVHSPDRLSRKYAYQVLLTEEFGRHGVETRFLNGPRPTSTQVGKPSAVSRLPFTTNPPTATTGLPEPRPWPRRPSGTPRPQPLRQIQS